MTMAFDECTPVPGVARGGRGVDGSCRCAGPSARAARFVERPGHGALRHRAGRRPCRSAANVRPRGSIEIGFDGYAIGGLAVGEGQATMLRHARRDRAVAARRPAALSDGRRQARRHRRRGRARDRHVRLRPADPLRPHRPGLHPRRHAQPAQRPPRRRPRARSTPNAAARLAPATAAPISITWPRRGEILASMLLTGHNLHLLSGPDGRPARGDRRRGACGVPRDLMEEEVPMQSLQLALSQLLNRDAVVWLNHHDLKVLNGRLIDGKAEHSVMKSGEHTFLIPYTAIVAARSAQ